MKRPRVTVNARPAGSYAAPTERIIEFVFPDGRGGLISFRDNWTQDGSTTVHTRIVDIYRIDDGITVLCAPGHLKEA